MKTSYILGLAAIAAVGLVSCQDDQDPKISTPTEFKLNVPPMADQTIELSADNTVSFTVSQPNYGLTLAPTYGIEVSLTENFTPLMEGVYTDGEGVEFPIPAYEVVALESQIKGRLVVKGSNLASAINRLRGIGNPADYVEEDPRPVYVRATSIVGQAVSTAIASNIITLKYVKDYNAIVVDPYADCIYTPGGANGWNFDDAMRIPHSFKEDEPNMYKGYMVIQGDFKFTKQPAWPEEGVPGNYGADADFAFDEASGTWTGTLIENSQDNFKGPEAGLYYAEITITDANAIKGGVVGTVPLTQIKTIGIIGGFNDWGGDVEMTPEEGFTTWKADNVDLGDGGWKFRMNGEWTFNLGGDSLDELTQDGNNIPDGGVHNVILDFSTLPYSAKLK